MVKLLIVRHGYSVTNRMQTFAGHLDVELDEIGLRQAECLKEFLCDYQSIDAIYSSDLQRTVATARPTADALGLPIRLHKGLRELNVGEWQGMTTTDVARKYPSTFNVYKTDVGVARPDGGETYSELAIRADKAMREIADENEGKTVAVFTHGGVIRALRCLWNGHGMEYAKNIPHVPNASVSTVIYENGDFHFESIGYSGHLRELAEEKNPKQLF